MKVCLWNRTKWLVPVALGLAVAILPAGAASAHCPGAEQFQQAILESPRSPFSDFRPGRRYRLRLHRESTLRDVEYMGAATGPDGSWSAEFRSLSGDRQVIRVKPEDVVGRMDIPIVSGNTQLVATVLSRIPALTQLARQVAFNPMRRLATGPGFEVVGSLIGSRRTAEEIAASLGRFDAAATRWGFVRPEMTRVVVDDRNLLPQISRSLVGPLAMPGLTFNVWRRGRSHLVMLNSFMRRGRFVRSPEILWHERMHTLLRSTYSSRAFVNRSLTVQEALADFGAARLAGSPVFGEGALGRGRIIRNLETLETDLPLRGAGRMESLDQASHTRYHHNSLFMSHVLWRIQGALGEAEFERFFKPFVDDLNQYRESYESVAQELGLVARDPQQEFLYELEYFFAVLARRASGTPRGSVFRRVWQESIERYRLDPRAIGRLASRLRRSGSDFRYDPAEEAGGRSFFTGLAVTGAVVDGYLVYELLDD